MPVHRLIPATLLSPITGEWCLTCDGPSSSCCNGRIVRVPVKAAPVAAPVETPGW